MIFGALCLIVLIALVLGARSSDQSAAQLAHRQQRERMLTLKQLTEMDSQSLIGFSTDYSYWDELAQFAKKPSKTWGTINLTGPLDSFRLSAIWVLNEKGQVIWQSPTVPDSYVPVTPGTALDIMRHRKPVRQFFSKCGADYIELSASPIVLSDDAKRRGHVYGVLIAGRIWDAARSVSFERLSGSDIVFQEASTQPPETLIHGQTGFTYNQQLRGLQGEAVGIRSITQVDDLSALLLIGREESASRISLTALMIVPTVLLLAYLLVGKPLIAIRQSLEMQCVLPLNRYRRSKSEVGLLASIIERSIRQQEELVALNASLEAKVQVRTADLEDAYEKTIAGLAKALEYRDEETEGHCQRVTAMVVRLAKLRGIGPEKLIQIQRGALLHDIGKLAIPDRVLLKDGPLTPEEWKVMRRHPTIAMQMLEPIEFLRPALTIPHYHHEKWDGSGYPAGLKGEEIPIEARLFALVDIWDALRSDRPYRDAWPVERVLGHIRSLSGTHLDPDVVDLFFDMMEDDLGAAA